MQNLFKRRLCFHLPGDQPPVSNSVRYTGRTQTHGAWPDCTLVNSVQTCVTDMVNVVKERACKCVAMVTVTYVSYSPSLRHGVNTKQ